MAGESIAGTELAQLYVALFRRAPDDEGLEYWTRMREGGAGLAEIADLMLATEPARAYYPRGMSGEDITEALFRNVTGMEPDAETLAFWLDRLHAPETTVGAMAVQLIDHFAASSFQDAAGLRARHFFGNRVAIAQQYAENNGELASAVRLFGAAAPPLPASSVLALPGDASGVVDAGGFARLQVGLVAADVALQQVDPGTALVITGSPQGVPIFSEEHPTGLYRSVAYELGDSSGTADATTLSLVSADRISAMVTMQGIEYLFIESIDIDGIAQQPSYLGLGAAQLRGLTLSGNTGLTLAASDMPDLRFVDASACSGEVSVWLKAFTGEQVLLGGSAGDWLRIDSPSSHIDGGDGDDVIVATHLAQPGVHTLSGGVGADRFELSYVQASGSFDVITDFNPAEGDTLAHPGLFHAPQWPASRLSLEAAATLERHLDAAASGAADGGAPHALLNWFQFGGDTYIVLDFNPGSTFQFDRTNDTPADQVVKLLGLVDLGELTLSHGQLSLD